MPGWWWDWNWGWGWLATAGSIVLLGLFLVPWFFFLLNLNNLLDNVREENRAMPPSHVWLNFIPVFCLGWFLYTVIKVRDSVRAEYATRGWQPDGDFGYNLGIVAGVVWIASLFFGWLPLIGWLLPIAWLVCWVLYWLKTAEFRKRLDTRATWRSGAQPPPPYSSGPSYPPPGAPRYGQGPYAGQAPYSGQAPYPGQAPYSGQAPYPGQTPPAPQTPPAAPGTAASGPAAPPVYYPAPAAEEAAATGEGVGMEGAAAAGRDAGAAAEEAAVSTGEPGVSTEEPGEDSRSCGACGASYDPEDKFCRSCGLPLP